MKQNKEVNAFFSFLLTCMACAYVAGLADMNKVKMEQVATVSFEIKPSRTRLSCYLNCNGLIY